MKQRINLLTNAAQLVRHKPPVVVESDSTKVVNGVEPRQRPAMLLHFLAQLSDHLHSGVLSVVSNPEVARDEGQLSANLI